jgi:hypothetical protein
VKKWTEFIWVKIGLTGELIHHENEPSVFIKGELRE